MSEPVIETLDEWNSRLTQCGCCGMPTCPAPTMDCQSLVVYAISEGYFKGFGEGDAVWTLYATYTESLVQSSNYSANNTDGPFSSAFTYVGTLNKSTAWSYSGNISIQSDTFCISETIDPPSITSCTNSLSETITSFYQVVDDEAVYYRDDYSYTRTREDISGDDNPAHADWQVAADAWDAQPPEEREGERPPEPVEDFAECTFIDNITETFTTLDGNVTGYPVTYTEGFLRGLTSYSYGNGEFTNTFTRTYGGGIGYAGWVSAAEARVAAKTFSDSEDPECYGSYCRASYELTPEPVAPEPEEPVEGEPPPPAPTAPPVDLTLQVTKVRYRWRIPSTHAGTYFKITWDVLTEPTEYGVWKPLKDAFDLATAAHAAWVAAGSIGTAPTIPANPEAAPTPAATIEADLTYTWGGPGDTEDPDDASWFSDWYDLAPPTESGNKRVVNVRFECYGVNDYGNKPQVTGEAYEIPD
jgi:hypothetical protein